MGKILSLFLSLLMVLSIIASVPVIVSAEDGNVAPSADENFTEVFHSEVFKLWWAVAFDGVDDIYEFTPYHVKWYTNYKIDFYAYDSYYVTKETSYGSYTIKYYQIPADVFEAQALKHFNICDINALRDDTNYSPVYNAETHTYDMPDAGGFGDSITYVTKGYKDLGNGKYEVYGYTVEQAYDKPDDAVEGVDYIIMHDYGYAAEILKCHKITIEYNGTDVKFLSWETVSLDVVPDIQDLIHIHISSSWIIDTKSTVDKAGSKHKECTECGEILETATIKQLKCAAVKLNKVANVDTGVRVYWTKTAGADKYRVYRKLKGGSWKVIGYSTKGYFTDKTAKSGKVYYYSVRAMNEAGLGAKCTTQKSIKCLADPTLKSATSIKSGISLKWTKTAGASGYVVYRKVGNGSFKKLKVEKGISNLSYIDKSAVKGKKYTYKVKAYYGKTYSAYSNAKAVKDKY